MANKFREAREKKQLVGEQISAANEMKSPNNDLNTSTTTTRRDDTQEPANVSPSKNAKQNKPNNKKVPQKAPESAKAVTVSNTKSFRMTTELINELERYRAMAQLAGKKISYGEILEGALREYFKKHPY